MKRTLLLAGLVSLGCTTLHPRTVEGVLVLRTQFSQARTQAVVPVYSKPSIHHLNLKIYPLVGSVEQGLVAERTLLQPQLDSPIVLNNLKPQTHYRVKAFAYSASEETSLISTQDASSSTDILVETDDRPTFGVLGVQLINRDFSASATSSLTLTPGIYLPAGSESLVFSGLEGIVTTFAGSTTAGTGDGFRTAATFNKPRNLIIGSNGNFYVAEDGTHRVRKIDPAGNVTVLAGGSASGCSDGQGTNAKFYRPYGLALGPDGNFYLSDTMNHRICKITPTGAVTTVLGGGGSGYADATGTDARFNAPHGVVFDSQGNLYVSETNNNVIRKVAPNWSVTTFAGSLGSGYADGSASTAKFNAPHCMVMDPQGNLYVADGSNYAIRKITPQGYVSTIAGNGYIGSRDGMGTLAQFIFPTGIALDGQGNFYVGDRQGHRVRKIAANGYVSTLAGSGAAGAADGTGYSAVLNRPDGVALDASGNLYVGSLGGHLIVKIQ